MKLNCRKKDKRGNKITYLCQQTGSIIHPSQYHSSQAMPIDYFSIFGKSSTTGSSHVNLTMGGLVVAQGLYVCFVNKPKSKSALVIGLAVGGLYGISGYLINLNRAELGHALGCAVSVALSIRMGHYALK